MENFPLLLATFLILALAFLYHNNTSKRKITPNTKGTTVPEPAGSWPIIGHLHLLRGREPLPQALGAMANKYGPIFSLRLGAHNQVIVSNWEMAKECFTTHDKALATRPSIAAGKYLGYKNAVMGLAPYGPYLREIRKVATAELFSVHCLDMLRHVRVKEVNAFIKDLHRLSYTKVNMSRLFEILTFNINIRTIAGKSFSSKDYEEDITEAAKVKRMVEKVSYLCGVSTVSDALPSLERFDFVLRGHIRKMKEAAKEMDRILGNWLEEHHVKRKEAEGKFDGEEEDFMDIMLSSLPEDTTQLGHDKDNIIKATTMMFLLVGSESTSVTLTWALSLLLNNVQALRAAKQELDNQIGRNKWVEESDIHKLTYLQAIIKETLRLYPPTPLTAPRQAIEDCNISGHRITQGTRLIVNIWKLHRDPRIWTNPLDFQPERWLTAHCDVDFKGQHFEFIPFSSGRRSCPALPYAWLVVHLILACLLQGFDIEPMDGSPVDMSAGKEIALVKLNPLEVLLKPRLPPELYNFPQVK